LEIENMPPRNKAKPKAAGKSKPPLAGEPLADRKRRAGKILSLLKKLYPDATSALHWSDPLQMLIATILSAQCTDQRVNMVTPALFARYKTAADYAEGPLADIEAMIKSTGFFRNKAKSVQAACRRIAEQYEGKVPDTMEEMLTLPGVARKTANVVLGTAYGRNEGVVVDTHVGRVAWRLGLTWTSGGTKDALHIEQDLMQVIPRKSWTLFGHALVLHGRYICVARKPRCGECKLAQHCPSAFTFDNLSAGQKAQDLDD
jgi:endonuclease-3